MNFSKVAKPVARLRRVSSVLALLSLAALPAPLAAQCSVSTPVAFEPNPTGVGRPGTLSSGFSTSLALYRNTAGAPRILMLEAWGYSTLDITNPSVPVALKYDDLRLDPTTATTNPVRASGDGQSYIQTIGVSADGQRIISSVNGPAEPAWHNLVGRTDGGDGFGMWGDFGSSRASGTVIQQVAGGRYIAYATDFSTNLTVADVTTLPTANGLFTSLNLTGEPTNLPAGYAPSIAGTYVLYLPTTGVGVQIVDASTPGPAGNIQSGFKTMTLTNVPGDPFTRVPRAYTAAVDPADPTKLWVLVELSASTANGENSPSYGLVSISKDGNGNFMAPVAAGPVFRVPSVAGELWGPSGGSSSLVVSQGQLFALMWATRQTPTQQFALYSSSTTWAPAGGPVAVPPGFALAATSASAISGAVNAVYQYIPAGPKAYVVPMSCTPVNAPAASSLTVTNTSAGGAPVPDNSTIFLGDQLAITPNVVPSPLSKPLSSWSFDLDFHAGNAVEDSGVSPRVINPDLSQANGTAPAPRVLVGPCDPKGLGNTDTGAGCWTSVQGNAAAGGPDFGPDPQVVGATKPLKIALEATNQFGSANTAVFTVNWKVPAARVASSQILSGQPLVSASDGHPTSYKWYFGQTSNALLVSGCTTASCVPPVNTSFYWLTTGYANGYSTPDYSVAVPGLPYTVTSFVPAFTVNGSATGPLTAYTFQTLLILNNSQRGNGITANYQYYLCAAPCSDNDSGYIAFGLPDVAGASTVIPVPTTAGPWALRIKANNSGPNTPARWPDPNTTPGGFPITVSTAPPPIIVTVGASPNPANPGDTVQLSCSATGGTGTYTAYTWSTTAGDFSTTQNPTFRASNASSQAATFPATCTVTDTAGGSGNRTVNVTINKGAVSALNVQASANPNPALPGQLVQLSCSATGGTGQGYSYQWAGTVGGSFSNNPNFSFTASNNTTAPVTTPYYCTVTDSSNATGQATVPLTVYASSGPPGPACTAVDYTLKDYSSQQAITPVGAGQFSAFQVSVGQVIQFAPTNTTLATYSWSFGDGDTSALTSPQHAFQTGGTRTVSLSATGTNVCTTPTTYTVIVSGPTGNFSAAYEDATTITYSNVTAFKNIVFSAYDAPGAVDAYSWDFGDNTAHGLGQSVTHGFGPGTWTVKLTVTKGTASVSQTLGLTVIPPPEPPKWVVPGMAYVLGQVPGSTWVSDVTIFNPDATRTATYSVAFLDARNPVDDYSKLTWGAIQVPPLGSVASPNLLGDAFGQPLGAYGALMVRGDIAPLAPVVTARTFNNGDPGKGTFGLSVPQASVSGGVSSQASVAASVLIGLRQGASAYTNIGLVNLKNDWPKIQLNFFDAGTAALLATKVVDMAPYQALQINRALLDAGYTGTSDFYTVKVTILQGTAVYPYATVIDLNSTDPIVVTPTPTPTTSYRVPGIIRLTGANGEKWRSRVTLANPSSSPRTVHMVFSYVACNTNGCSNVISIQGDIGMTPGQTQSWDDFVKVWLTVKGFIPVDDGTTYASSLLDITPAVGDTNPDPVVVLGETYNDTPTGHVGLQIPGYTPIDGASRVGAYKRLALTGLASNAAFRTNLALFIIGGTNGKWVNTHVYGPDGTKLRDVPVFIDGFAQLNSATLFGGLSPDVSRFSVVVDNLEDGITVGGYATIIDNTSGDATFVKAAPVP